MEKPILFSAPMVLAILDGRKTQTRRVIKPYTDVKLGLKNQPIEDLSGWCPCTGEYGNPDSYGFIWKNRYGAVVTYALSEWFQYNCPYGQVGDRLWVRENWGLNHSDYIRPNPIPKTRPTDLLDDQLIYFATEDDAEITNEMPRCPSIHMPRWASRITLEITGVRVERLNDITEADAMAEGCKGHNSPPDHNEDLSPKEEFRDLWKSINGAESWAANPWVWVVEFKRVDQ